jgi:lipid A 3-O-deacylase
MSQMSPIRRIVVVVAMSHVIASPTFAQVTNAPDRGGELTNSPRILTLDSKPSPVGIWVDDSVGKGFRPGLHEAGLSLGGGFATHELGGTSPHDLALSRVYYGWMLGKLVGKGKWYRGNWELIQELFGGAQVHPGSSYVIGETTVLRYNFATERRWIPFLDAGAGLTATDIGSPDLGSVFEFNLQVGPGVNIFWRKNSALTFQYRFIHMSDAEIKSPNAGVNLHMFYAGVTCYF